MIPPAVALVEKSSYGKNRTDQIEFAGRDQADHARQDQQKDGSAKKSLRGQLNDGCGNGAVCNLPQIQCVHAFYFWQLCHWDQESVNRHFAKRHCVSDDLQRTAKPGEFMSSIHGFPELSCRVHRNSIRRSRWKVPQIRDQSWYVIRNGIRIGYFRRRKQKRLPLRIYEHERHELDIYNFLLLG